MQGKFNLSFSPGFSLGLGGGTTKETVSTVFSFARLGIPSSCVLIRRKPLKRFSEIVFSPYRRAKAREE